jgi:hypothetical protein
MTGLTASVRRRVLLTAAAIALLGLAGSGALPGLLDSLAYLLPPLLLLLALATHRYPGERALLALIGRGGSRRRCPRVAGAAPRPRLRAALPRGGRLIASSLAVRPPPPRLVALS